MMSKCQHLIEVLVWSLCAAAIQVAAQSLPKVTPDRPALIRDHATEFRKVFASGEQYERALWANGRLFGFGIISSAPGPGLIAMDRDGRVTNSLNVWTPDASQLSIGGAGVLASGQLVVAAGAGTADGKVANFVANINAQGDIDQIVRTNPFVPLMVCVLEDGSIWSYGWERNEADPHSRVSSYAVLRQIDLKRGIIKGVVNRETLGSPELPSRGRYPGDVSLTCNSRTVGLYYGPSNEFVSYSPGSAKLEYRKISGFDKKVRVTGVTLTENGRIFASLRDYEETVSFAGIFELAGPSSENLWRWKRIDETANAVSGSSDAKPIPQILGHEGDCLVVLEHPKPAYKVAWLQPTQ